MLVVCSCNCIYCVVLGQQLNEIHSIIDKLSCADEIKVREEHLQ